MLDVADMSSEERALVDRMCGRKRRHVGPRAARRHADHLNAERPADRAYGPYLCPVCHHWHVGRVPSMETLQKIANLIRGLPINGNQQHKESA